MVLMEFMKVLEFGVPCNVYQFEELVFSGYLENCPVEYLTERVERIIPLNLNTDILIYIS